MVGEWARQDSNTIPSMGACEQLSDGGGVGPAGFEPATKSPLKFTDSAGICG